MTKTVYYDRGRKKPTWMTIVRTNDGAVHTEHETERAARTHIGLKGGSLDPEFRPRGTGGETVEAK